MPSLDHVNIHTRDAAAMIGFLKTILNAEEGFRPPFDMPGHWLYLEGHPAIHLNIVERDGDFPQGVLNHVAFAFFDQNDVLKGSGQRDFRSSRTGYPDPVSVRYSFMVPEGSG